MLKALRGAAVVFGIASLTFTNSMCNQLSDTHTRAPTRHGPSHANTAPAAAAGVDWSQVKQLIDCSDELRELVAPGGTEDLFSGGGLPNLPPSLGGGGSSADEGESDSDEAAFDLPAELPRCCCAVCCVPSPERLSLCGPL